MKAKKKKVVLKEKLESQDLERIRKIIRSEIAELFFDLYRKRTVWSK
jgi:hypothetical protein|tara:strand:+ start:334 stop:474 length:141 start_codon:yes stop_codon:yes gene_type:complete